MSAAALPADLGIQRLVDNARSVQPLVASWTQERVDSVVAALAWSAFKDDVAVHLSRMAVEETGFGCFEDSYTRHRQRVLGVMRDLHGVATVGCIENCPERGLRKIAKPLGLIAALTPATAPVAGVVVNALMMLKTRNVVIFTPNPGASQTVGQTVLLLQDALEKVGAPRHAIQAVAAPTRESAGALMRAADLVVAAGGEGVVRRAYASGRPAYGAGVGNAVVTLDETADLEDAAQRIIAGKAFDNGTSCSSESSLVVERSVYTRLIALLRQHGAHLCNADEAAKLRQTVWPRDATVSRYVVGKSAENIATQSGFQVPAGTRVLMAEGDDAIERDTLAGEKISPVLGLWQYDGPIENAIRIVKRLLSRRGLGHSSGVYSRLPENINRMSEALNVGRIMVNQSTGFGNTGSDDNGMPVTVVLSCGTWGGSSSSENMNWRHLLNYTWVSEVISRRRPDADELFRDHWAQYGK